MKTEMQTIERLMRQGFSNEKLFKVFPKNINYIKEYREFLDEKIVKITKEQIENWVGSDNQNPNYYLALLEELANGRYKIESFKEDVSEYNR